MWSARALATEIVYRAEVDSPREVHALSLQDDSVSLVDILQNYFKPGKNPNDSLEQEYDSIEDTVQTTQPNNTLPLKPLLISRYFKFVHSYSEYVECIDQVLSEHQYQGYTNKTSCSTQTTPGNSTAHSGIQECTDEVKLTFKIEKEIPPPYRRYCTLMKTRQSDQDQLLCFISSEMHQKRFVDYLEKNATAYSTKTIIKTAQGPKAQQNYTREILCYNELFDCSSPHLVRLIAADPNTYTLKMEKMSFDLKYQIQMRYDTIIVRNLHSDVVCGLKVLQERGFAHRDIKPGNILYDENTGVYKLTDFGYSGPTTEVKKSQRGTPAYVLPKQATLNPGYNWGQANDKFGLGIILLEIVMKGYITHRSFAETNQPDYWNYLQELFTALENKHFDTNTRLSDRDYMWLYFKEEVVPMITSWASRLRPRAT
jgi:hypothetical protein